MTRSWYKENRHILDAWANGEDVEIFISGEWQPVNKDREFWMHDCEYRIKPKAEYPIYARNKHYDIWVKFTSLRKGEVIGMKPPKQKIYICVGEESSQWIPYNNKEEWEIIPNPYELHDKDPIWCWDDTDITKRELRFWSAKNSAAYSYDGVKDGIIFNYCEKVLPWEEPEWVKEARKRLKD